MYDREKLKAKAVQYCELARTSLTRELGFGTQGIVYETGHNTAIKVYDRDDGYARERSVYLRLKERSITSIRGMNIPRFETFSDELLVLEMSIVHVPCIIDFGGAYIDKPPAHLARDESWMEQKAEEFGENWEEAQAVIRELEHRADIYLADINIGNIKFGEKLAGTG